MRCIVLNQSREFIGITEDWSGGVRLLLKGRVTPLAVYDKVARSEKQEIAVPAVVVLNEYKFVGRRRQLFNAPTKRTVLVRDRFTCAYCGTRLTNASCHLDHVVPRSRGGKDALDNVVAACGPCNWTKADRTPSEAGLTLKTKPRSLTNEEKLELLCKTHRANERNAWLACLKEHNLSLF